MSKIAGEINAEMMHPKVIHAQRKELFFEMVRKTGSQQSVIDRMLQEIQFLRDREGAMALYDQAAVDSLERELDELKAAIEQYVTMPAFDGTQETSKIRLAAKYRLAAARKEKGK